MEPRARIRTLLRRAGMSAALAALLVPAAAGTASAKKHHHHHHKAKLPVVTSVKPLDAAIGDTLTIRGRNFRRGVNRNTVAFRRTGARVVFVKARIGTSRLLRVVLPDSLAKALKASSGAIVPTRLQIRVLAAKFGKRYTRRGLSPLIAPRRPPVVTPAVAAADGDCDGDGLKNSVDDDADNDLLSNTEEAKLHTDPCKADTDGDGVTDGYEYQSAVDLNDDEYRVPQDIVPAPYKKPYPNPLFKDADVDYDGDGLTLGVEYKLWAAYRNPATRLNNLIYSDGNQYSAYGRDAQGHRPGPLVDPGLDPHDKYANFIAWAKSTPAPDQNPNQAHYWTFRLHEPAYGIDGTFSLDDFNHDGSERTQPGPLDPPGPWTDPGTGGVFYTSETQWYDEDHNGFLSDDERDEDADGLSNYEEFIGPAQPGWWAGCYSGEKPYPVPYAGTDPTDPDTDGDLIRDGADDQDHDDVPNLQEMYRSRITGMARQGNCKPPSSGANPDPTGVSYVNPFNPCLPFADSRTCERHPDMNDRPAGLDPETKFFILN